LNVTLASMFLLVVSGAISSALLSSGYLLPSFIVIGLTAGLVYQLDRKEKKTEAMLKDKPIY
jgi:hypothetical protein